MTLDWAVAQAVMQVRNLERALHDQGPWAIRVCGSTYPAVRWVMDDRVVFKAHLPEMCLLGDDGETDVELLCNGEAVGFRRISFEDGENTVEWVIVLRNIKALQA